MMIPVTTVPSVFHETVHSFDSITICADSMTTDEKINDMRYGSLPYTGIGPVQC